MLTLDAVRTAVLSAQPWSRLDELVRAELASGRTTRQIYKSLMALADEIDATPGLSEDGSDAFGDTLDALTGMCHRDCQYKDPPNATLPSEEEIAELPRWARVAFAARCARRVLPFVKHPRLKTYDFQEFGSAVNVAESAASACHGTRANAAADTAQSHAWRVASIPTARTAVRIIIESARVADRAEMARDASTAGTDARIAWAAARANWADSDSIARVAIIIRELVVVVAPAFIRRDFDHVARLATWQKWDDNTPVPPEVFGPLWPEGPPKGWPPISDVPQRAELGIEAFARDRATEQMIEDDIVNLFNALNRYHIARSGVRLTLEQFRSLLPAFVPAEV